MPTRHAHCRPTAALAGALALLLALLPFARPPVAAADDTDATPLIQDGQTDAVILMPRVFGGATMHAARELQAYLKQISGAHLRISFADPTPWQRHDRPAIFLRPDHVGPYTAARNDRDQFTIIRNRYGQVTIKAPAEEGLLFGAYQFLRELGVRWYIPGPLGEEVPEQATITLNDREKTYVPAFATREIDFSGYNDWHFDNERLPQQHRAYDLWLMRNGFNFIRNVHDRPWHHFNFNQGRHRTGHNIHQAVLGDVSFDKQPERFPMIERDGETKRRKKGQICYSDPRNLDAAVRAARDFFKERPTMLSFSLSLQDRGGNCICDACIKMNGGVRPDRDPNRVVWKFINRAARRLREHHPQRNIACYTTYGAMTRPPRDIKSEPNILAATAHVMSNGRPIDAPDAVYNRQFLRNITRVSEAGPKMSLRAYTMFAGSPQPLALLDNIPVYAERNYQRYHTESMGRDELRWMVGWAQGRLLWNPDRDPKALLEQFCRDYYGAAGDDVLAVVREVDQEMRSVRRFVLGSLGTTQTVMTEALVADGRARLKQARDKVEGRHAERLTRFIKTFEFWARQAETMRAFYDALSRHDMSGKKQASEALDAFVAYWNEANLARICSPRARSSIKRLRGRLDRMQRPIAPTRADDLAGADKARMLDAVFLRAEQPAELGNTFVLPDVWRFRLDVHRRGLKNAWHEPAHSTSDWHKLSVTDHYERQGFYLYDGYFWYRTRFEAPQFPQEKKIYLRFGGLDDDGDIYINGQRVHRRYHTRPRDWKRSFEIDVTDAIQPGEENVIAIRGYDGYGLGGLWRPAALYTK